MCLILFANKLHPDYPLVLAANRDEHYARPAAPAAFWSGDPHIYGGRDLEQGGTWLGVTREGVFAAVTNYRGGVSVQHSVRSRGELVAGYLRGHQRPADYLAQVRSDADAYNGFNLIAGNLTELHVLSNRGDRGGIIKPGVHGLSNHLLDTPWPKVQRGKQRLNELLGTGSQALIDGLFDLLCERTIAADDALPATGVGVERERVLSPAFIVSPGYGTRASTVVLIGNDGKVVFIERSFGEGGKHLGTTTATFALERLPTAAV